MKKQRTANTGLAKVAVQCSADTFVVNQSMVLRINFCAENPPLRKAENRYSACLTRVCSVYVRARIRVRDSSEKPAVSEACEVQTWHATSVPADSPT
jgi:hypothetical protein